MSEKDYSFKKTLVKFSFAGFEVFLSLGLYTLANHPLVLLAGPLFEALRNWFKHA